MKSIKSDHYVALKVTLKRDPKSGQKVVNVDSSDLATVQSWEVASCVYVIVRDRIIQYVGCSSVDFHKRFCEGIRAAEKGGYKWPTSDGTYDLFIWKIRGPRPAVEAVEAEVAFLHRAVLGDWPIELNQISPKRGRVQAKESQLGKSMSFGIFAWLMEDEHIYASTEDMEFLGQLLRRTYGLSADAMD